MMGTQNELIKKHVGQVLTNLETDDGTEDPKRELRLLQGLIGLFSYIGAEAVQVLFRRNFGKNAIHIPMLIFSSLLLFGVSAWSFSLSFSENYISEANSSDAHFITGVMLCTCASIILYKGYSEFSKANRSDNPNPDTFTGESYILNFLLKDKFWTKEKIQTIAEPIVVLVLGSSYLIWDKIGGITLLILGLSVWGKNLCNSIYNNNQTMKNINSQKSESSNKRNVAN